jgi:DNA-directed RNA polymerase specialized sigma24 family protein
VRPSEISYHGRIALDKILGMNASTRNDDGDGRYPGPSQFQTTRWSMVISARDGDATEAREALGALCATYWYPLYAFVRRKGHDGDVAQDLVQGFFTRLLEKGDLAAVERSKGKFRSFLMAACTHYLANQMNHNRAQIRGGGRSRISIDRLEAEGRYTREPAHALTADRLFERQWALALLENVLNALAAEMTEAGKAQLFEALRPALLGGAERTPYSAIAAALDLTENAARAAAHRIRRRYRELMREEVARTLSDPADLDEEIRSLFAALGD